jgi:hypothetical protein
MRFALFAVVLAVLMLSPSEARAHLDMTSPTSRYGPNTLKSGPCGISGGGRTENVAYYEPGETIEVTWDEYIDHPGHYRIAFDEDGDDDFVDPATMMELYSNDTVLLDGIDDKEGRGERYYVETVTLPNVTCDNCTLQLIQVMYDKPPYETADDDIYYQCADLVLREGAPGDAGVDSDAGLDIDAGMDIDAGTGPAIDPGAGDSGGCTVAHGAVDQVWMMAFFLVVFARRLARRQRFPV